MQVIKYIGKRMFKGSLMLLLVLFANGCEEVIDVPLDGTVSKLVVDASINWEKGSRGNNQKIVLTTTTSYYDLQFPVVSGAIVKISNTASTIFDFIEEGTTGIYKCNNFQPKIGDTYTLSIQYKGQNYTATETMHAVPQIDKILQTSSGGILKDQYEVFFYYKDPVNVANYDLVRFMPNYLKVPTFYAGDDRYSDGKDVNWNYSEKDLKPGNTVAFTHYGISQQYFNYMSILISVSGGASGQGPFQTAPVAVRGNVINQSDNDNYALGYFSVSEIESINYMIQ